MAFFSKPLPIITSRNNLFNSFATLIFTLKLHETIPPNALIGSHAYASLKLSTLLLFTEAPQGFECFTITVPVFLGNVFERFNAENISL